MLQASHIAICLTFDKIRPFIYLTFSRNRQFICLTFYIFNLQTTEIQRKIATFATTLKPTDIMSKQKYLSRRIDDALLAWKNSQRHKPLLLRGARQVGKSSSVRHLAEQFDNFVEINFERKPKYADIFKGDRDARHIVEMIKSIMGADITAGKTLLFLDEIQMCPEAISTLRFFWEDMPELHVIAAGSLLEFTLNEIPTFGVGRIHSMFMYPMSFDEFLTALGMDALRQAKEKATPCNALPDIQHEQLVSLFRTYLMVGGMPEAVTTWVDTHSYTDCQAILKEIAYNYEVDFAKYHKRANTTLLRQTLHSAAHQIGGKFVYSQVSRDFRSFQIKEALSLLTLAGLLIPVYSTAANGFPLGAEADEKCAKYLFMDSGLLLAILGMDFGSITAISEEILIGNATDLVNKGHITEMVAGLEMVKNMPHDSIPALYFWTRDTRGALAEVDYIIAKDMRVLPIEVKAEVRGGMKSLYSFVEAKGITRAVRTSLENFGQFTNGNCTIDIYPLYALSNLVSSRP